MKQYRINGNKHKDYQHQVKYRWFPLWVSCKTIRDLKTIALNVLKFPG